MERINEQCDLILAIDDAKSSSETLKKAKLAARKIIPLPQETNGVSTFDAPYVELLVERASFFASKSSFSTPASNVKDAALSALREITVGVRAEGLKDTAAKLLILAKTLRFRDDILATGELLAMYKEKFIEKKRQAGLLSFHDTLEMAVDILLNDLPLRNFYKKRIQAVMIDEFQDNNEMQKRLLYLLSEKDGEGIVGKMPDPDALNPAKLFFVGDEKQSIYRFRGADVAVFMRLSEELGNTGVSLETNYRSTPELVGFFNAVFPAVFDAGKDLAEVSDFEAKFSPVRYAPHKTHAGICPVEVHVQETKRGGDKTREFVENIPKGVGEALAAAERIVEGALSGEFAFKDVAVLFRSTSHQNEYERVFREAGIPIIAADPRGVYAEAPANDFYAILRLSLYPLDRNAYATVLRSPFVKLGDEGVFHILLEHPDDPFPDNYTKFPFFIALPDMEKERFAQGKRVFDALKEQIDLESIASVVSFLWYETGYRTTMLARKDFRPNLPHFEYLYSLALNADRRQLSMGAFLNELSPLIGTTDKTETGDVPEVENEVLFLTVHKSKGLEFPTVILADAGGEGQGDRNSAPYYMSREFGPVVNMKSDTQSLGETQVNYFYEREKALIQKQEEAELKRLFYVAATRAENRLLIFGSREVTKDDEAALSGCENDERLAALVKLPHISGKEKKILKKSFFDLLALGLRDGKAEKERLYDVFQVETVGYADYYGRIRRLREKTERISQKNARKESEQTILEPPDFFCLTGKALTERETLFTTPSDIEKFALDAYPVHQERYMNRTKLPDFACQDFLQASLEPDTDNSGRAQKFGTLCHRLIEKLLAGAESLSDASLRETRCLFPDESPLRVQSLAEEASSIAERFLASPLGKEVLESPRHRSEFPFLLPLSGGGKKRAVIVQGQIDILYEHEGHCVVLDFKTDSRIIRENHRFQIACYQRAAAAFSPLPPRAALVYLRNMEAVWYDPAISDDDLFSLAAEAAL